MSRKIPEVYVENENGKKVCATCSMEKPIELFSKDKYNKDGKHHSCKECQKKQYGQKEVGKGSLNIKDYKNMSQNNKVKWFYNLKKCWEYEDLLAKGEIGTGRDFQKAALKVLSVALMRTRESKAGSLFLKLMPFELEELKSKVEKEMKENNLEWSGFTVNWKLTNKVVPEFFPYKDYEDPNFKKFWSLINIEAVPIRKINKRNTKRY